ncbi:MAG: tRNA (N(6)-L-threonylcarbamoyladenosine(37)-C(2))-methylthiotransferase MtaB [Oscillospiraceae bacterium]|jgi:threonylcarbamoyladenosine tRNA methylthiotransferase MtaB|nr:tRNA (N(6)-L-threonylcarbamoyladenosine(37)-C(2))-methylthiotransferase MtaB [Oscillospiraceae bacterium]
MRIAFYTLGCKVNQAETGALERLAEGRGHELVAWTAEADAYVVNTCTVTAVSDKKSRQAIRGVRRAWPGALVAVCGCLGQTSPAALAALGADLVCGVTDREAMLTRLEELRGHRAAESPLVATRALDRAAFEPLPAGSVAGRARALLKVQDGCDNRCTYCVIPVARGPARSLPLDAARAEAARLAGEGYREIVITGIEISAYGRDLPDAPDLAALAETVCRAAPDTRVRLGSLEPRAVTEDFVARLSVLPNLCPPFHVALQSGCDDTLRRMGRRYDTALYARSLALLRAAFPDCALAADLILGFPGEREEDFENTLSFVKECRFTDMHIFPYSKRLGTPAADFPDQVPRAVKQARAARARALADEMTRAYDRALVGQTLDVLFEEQTPGGPRGHGQNYRPVTCPRADGQTLRGQIRPVVVTGVTKDGLLGRLEA